jgi:hypothetical protein
MGQVLHGCATTTHAVRTAIQRSKAPLKENRAGQIGTAASSIDPPTASYAIMRRARPYRGENSGPGKDRCGELDTQTRN